MKKYIPSQIEPKWQEKWRESGLYLTNLSNSDRKYYVLVELPYTSGDLHMGHWFTFTMGDILARFKSRLGFNVLFPNGFDAFGLPAENAAIKNNIHPRDWTYKNMERMRAQFETLGTSIDWTKTMIACDPKYYKWNQWIFLKMLQKGLAYRGKVLSNWCPKDQTVLANENVEDGKCWRCGTEVIQKQVEQWFFKITDYADRLQWRDPPQADWPKPLRVGQNDWIGRSEGLLFTAPVKDSALKIQTFSAHFEAFYADTFVVIAPDHPLLAELVDGVSEKLEILEYANKIVNKRKDREYAMEEKEVEGIFTGKYIIDPIGNGELPIWVASYALKDYGTGIVKCSAHDERDFAFAKKYNLKLKPVLFPEDPIQRKKVEALEVCYTDMKNGILSQPEEFSGRPAGSVKDEIMEYAVKKGFAKKSTQYHLHDWSISRQRYWGTPIPIIYCDKCGIVSVPEKDLPVELPYKADYAPKGKAPLATAEDWLKVECPKCGGPARREVETMDTFVDSAWYFFRYLDPENDLEIFDKNLAKNWMPLEIYIGGPEHTFGHALYSRFFTMVFKDLGLIDFEEYAKKRIHHGTILGPDGARMSKSRGNVVNPDAEVKNYGADAIRLYLMFLGPVDIVTSWNPDGVNGAYHFLQRVWGLQEKLESRVKSPASTAKRGEQESSAKLSRLSTLATSDLKMMHKTIKKVTQDLEEIKFNTPIAALMEWLNYLSRKTTVSIEEYRTFLILLSPFAPHIAEELWEVVNGQWIMYNGQLKNKKLSIVNSKLSIHKQSWPQFDNKYTEEQELSILVQVNNKVRDILMIQKDIISNKDVIEKMAKESEKVQKFLEGKSVKKIVYIPGKVISFLLDDN